MVPTTDSSELSQLTTQEGFIQMVRQRECSTPVLTSYCSLQSREYHTGRQREVFAEKVGAAMSMRHSHMCLRPR